MFTSRNKHTSSAHCNNQAEEEERNQSRRGKRLSEEDPKSLMKRVALGDVTNKPEVQGNVGGKQHHQQAAPTGRITRVILHRSSLIVC